MGKTEFKQRFMERVKQAREARGLTQAQMAEILGMHQAKYHKYESRSYLPHDLVHRFCLAAGVDVVWLFTGRFPAASSPEGPSTVAKRPQRRIRRKAA